MTGALVVLAAALVAFVPPVAETLYRVAAERREARREATH